MRGLSFHQLHALPTMVGLMTAARALGIGRTKAYELAREGGFPCRIVRIGAGYNVPTADLLRVLGVTPQDQLDGGSYRSLPDDDGESDGRITVK